MLYGNSFRAPPSCERYAVLGSKEYIPDPRLGCRQVCTRNDDLKDVIARTPESRKEDLVFLQNGVLGPMLETYGLGKNTQVRGWHCLYA